MSCSESGPSYGKDIEQIETEILLEGIFRRWGYDFRHYAHATLQRRLKHRLGLSGLKRLNLHNHAAEGLEHLLLVEEQIGAVSFRPQ